MGAMCFAHLLIKCICEGLKMSKNARSEINEFTIDDICVDEDIFGAARKGWVIIGINIGLLSTMFLFF